MVRTKVRSIERARALRFSYMMMRVGEESKIIFLQDNFDASNALLFLYV